MSETETKKRRKRKLQFSLLWVMVLTFLAAFAVNWYRLFWYEPPGMVERQLGDGMIIKVQTRNVVDETGVKASEHEYHGKCFVFDKYGRQLCEGEYAADLPSGKWTFYHNNGRNYAVDGPVGLSSLMQLHKLERPLLKYPYFTTERPQGLRQGENIFEAMQQQDFLLHRPYDSFSPVVDFVQAAAEDPDVLGIKMTLYRVGGSAPSRRWPGRPGPRTCDRGSDRPNTAVGRGRSDTYRCVRQHFWRRPER